jgi:antitoxin (DNA-binding transcriptional repressor) of toxin-antitoxin stability system
MKRMTVADAEKGFTGLVNEVYRNGISVELEQGDKVIARLTPAEKTPALTIGELNAFLRSLPKLDDDADEFAKDMRAIRAQFPSESDTWD